MAASEPIISADCRVVELRQYTLFPGQRDALIELFDREFVETQEAEGMLVIGQFRDLDDPDRFVWLRGFQDMAARHRALAGFYGGPTWKRHRDAANATMKDSSDVLLLRPVDVSAGFGDLPASRPPVGAEYCPPSLVMATIFPHLPGAGEEFAAQFARVKPTMVAFGATPVASFLIETARNTFSALPVRTDENLFVSFSIFNDVDAATRHLDVLDTSTGWRSLLPLLAAAPQHLKLAPTARSLLR